MEQITSDMYCAVDIVVDVDGTGTNWSCSKCGEEVSKERVDQVGGQQSLIAKILSNFIKHNSIKCSHS